MPDINANNTHQDQYLTDISVAYRPTGLVYDQIAPAIPVAKQTNLYAIYDKATWLRRNETDRAPGQNPNEVQFSVSSDSYLAKNYALGTYATYEDQANADDPYAPLQDGTEFLRDQLGLDAEVRMASKIFTGVGTTIAATEGWDDYTSSDPRLDVIAAMRAIHETTGKRANTAIVSQVAWEVVRYNPTIVNAVFPGGGGGGMVNQAQLADFLGVERVLIGEAIYNTAAPGLAASYTAVWSNAVVLAHVAPRPGLRRPSFCYQFNWTGGKLSDGGPGNFNVMTQEMPKAGRTDLWTGYYVDEKVVASELGAAINTHINSVA